MKNSELAQAKITKGLMLALVVALSVGCAKEKKGSSSAPQINPNAPYTPDTNGPGQGPGVNFQYGGTTQLQIVSLNTMSSYTRRAMNNPQNIKLNVNLVSTGKNQHGSSSYGGTINVSYTEDGYIYNQSFTSGTTQDSTPFNIFHIFGTQKAFHGFFEDYLGGMILVIDQIVDLGDGAGPQDKVGGSVWFKNFRYATYPHPPTYCWFLAAGPYDCRAWVDGKSVNTYRQIEPDNGYIKLGTFTDLSIAKAFNGAKVN